MSGGRQKGCPACAAKNPVARRKCQACGVDFYKRPEQPAEASRNPVYDLLREIARLESQAAGIENQILRKRIKIEKILRGCEGGEQL
jgi:transposase-like protein